MRKLRCTNDTERKISPRILSTSGGVAIGWNTKRESTVSEPREWGVRKKKKSYSLGIVPWGGISRGGVNNNGIRSRQHDQSKNGKSKPKRLQVRTEEKVWKSTMEARVEIVMGLWVIFSRNKC